MSGSSFTGTFSGGSMLGTTSLGTSGFGTGIGTATGGVSRMNPFASYFANPMAAGLPNNTGRAAAFGQPLYGTTTGTTGYGTGGLNSMMSGRLGTTGLGGGLATPSVGMVGGGGMGLGMSSTAGNGRAPTYTATVDFNFPVVTSGTLITELQGVLDRSSTLSPGRRIQVVTQGPFVVLRGTVANEHDRTLAENLVRLTPGVHEVRNELTSPDMQPPPARFP
jgi:hypothetical protein